MDQAFVASTAENSMFFESSLPRPKNFLENTDDGNEEGIFL